MRPCPSPLAFAPAVWLLAASACAPNAATTDTTEEIVGVRPGKVLAPGLQLTARVAGTNPLAQMITLAVDAGGARSEMAAHGAHEGHGSAEVGLPVEGKATRRLRTVSVGESVRVTCRARAEAAAPAPAPSPAPAPVRGNSSAPITRTYGLPSACPSVIGIEPLDGGEH
jgi:hypothetical protein